MGRNRGSERGGGSEVERRSVLAGDGDPAPVAVDLSDGVERAMLALGGDAQLAGVVDAERRDGLYVRLDADVASGALVDVALSRRHLRAGVPGDELNLGSG